MVVVLGDADIADGAVLAAGWLEAKAGAARLARVEEDAVIGILSHMFGVREGGDDGGCGADG